MRDKRFAACRAEFDELKRNLTRYVRLNSKYTLNSAVRLRRQQRGKHGSSFFREGPLCFFRHIMAHYFKHEKCLMRIGTPNVVGRT